MKSIPSHGRKEKMCRRRHKIYDKTPRRKKLSELSPFLLSLKEFKGRKKWDGSTHFPSHFFPSFHLDQLFIGKKVERGSMISGSKERTRKVSLRVDFLQNRSKCSLWKLNFFLSLSPSKVLLSKTGRRQSIRGEKEMKRVNFLSKNRNLTCKEWDDERASLESLSFSSLFNSFTNSFKHQENTFNSSLFRCLSLFASHTEREHGLNWILNPKFGHNSLVQQEQDWSPFSEFTFWILAVLQDQTECVLVFLYQIFEGASLLCAEIFVPNFLLTQRIFPSLRLILNKRGKRTLTYLTQDVHKEGETLKRIRFSLVTDSSSLWERFPESTGTGNEGKENRLEEGWEERRASPFSPILTVA